MKEKAIYCPRCNSPSIYAYLGGMTGTYRCKECGYMGTLIIEKTFVKTMGETKKITKK
ncbi:MAG: hypothetical protein ABIJ21_00235 [Nanoarchaeota archaeon]